MKVVSELFGSGQMASFCTQSAETMKEAAVHGTAMKNNLVAMKGVDCHCQGDNHDMPKNLVDIILSNNGL